MDFVMIFLINIIQVGTMLFYQGYPGEILKPFELSCIENMSVALRINFKATKAQSFQAKTIRINAFVSFSKTLTYLGHTVFLHKSEPYNLQISPVLGGLFMQAFTTFILCKYYSLFILDKMFQIKTIPSSNMKVNPKETTQMYIVTYIIIKKHKPKCSNQFPWTEYQLNCYASFCRCV